MNKLIEYFNKLTQADTNESSKRFSALYTVLILITYIVARFTNKDNLVIVLTTLCSFALALFSVAVWQGIKKKQ